MQGKEGGGKFSLSAEKFGAALNPEGWVASLAADGSVAGVRRAAAGTDRFWAEHVEFAMLPGHNLIRQMTANGGVAAESQQAGDSHVLKTEALKVNFSAGQQPPRKGSGAQTLRASAGQQEMKARRLWRRLRLNRSPGMKPPISAPRDRRRIRCGWPA